MGKTTLKEVERRYTKFKESTLKLKSLREEKEENLENRRKLYKEIEKVANDLNRARILLEESNIASREFIQSEVEQLVTQGLRTIFGNPLIKFNIEFVEKRNQTEANFYLTSESDEESRVEGEITFSYGGGVVDIISISLRIILMQLLKLEGPIILDEPGKNISVQYVDKFAKFLTDVSSSFDRQIIMVTHNATLANCANNIINVEQKNGVSEVRNGRQ